MKNKKQINVSLKLIKETANLKKFKASANVENSDKI